MALVILGLHNRHQQLVADLQVGALLFREALQFVAGYDTFALGPDVDQDLIAVNLHDGAFNNITMLELPVLLLGSPEQVFHRGVGGHVIEPGVARAAHYLYLTHIAIIRGVLPLATCAACIFRLPVVHLAG